MLNNAKNIPVFVVAAFSNVPFRGNPAGVCILPRAIDPSYMQAIAAELRQPETAFLIREEDRWGIRWFSPVTEVDLCGHATLAAAHVLWNVIGVEGEALLFATASGMILAAQRDTAGLTWLDLPAVPGIADIVPHSLAECVRTDWVAASRHGNRWILELSDAGKVRSARPDIPRLKQTGIRSLILTARSDSPDFHIISRNFAPIVGVNEDQVTGTAHACLAPYWYERLGAELQCWQASERGGMIRTRLVNDEVRLGGNAVIELRGTLSIL